MKRNNDQQQVEKKIIETLRGEGQPSELSGVVERVSSSGTDSRIAREAIRTLVDRGVLQVTLDWKLKIRKQNIGNPQRA